MNLPDNPSPLILKMRATSLRMNQGVQPVYGIHIQNRITSRHHYAVIIDTIDNSVKTFFDLLTLYKLVFLGNP
jgi:hypothetical protein